MDLHAKDADESGANMMTRGDAIAALSDALEMPVIAVVAGWLGDRRVDLGEEALRAFLHVFDAEMAAWKEATGKGDEVAIYLVGRGGYPEFAQGLARALRGRGVHATAVIPEQINGTFALAALGMEQRLMHPYAAIGAYDCPALRGARGAPDADTLRELEVFHKLESSAAFMNADLLPPRALVAIAHQRRQARHARQLLGRLLGEEKPKLPVDPGAHSSVASELSMRTLGAHLALCAEELGDLGVSTVVASPAQAELIWRLFEFYEEEFQVLHPAVPRYTKSGIGDEVEFAPAMEMTGAVIEGGQEKFVYELDTGRPDPESGMLDGNWRW